MIVLNNVTKTYRAKKGPPFAALKGIDLVLPSRGIVFLLGRSGSGKTTLLNLIGLLDAPTSGTVEIDGVVPEGKQLDDFRNRFSGFVFQDFALLENETVAQNIALALQLQSVKETGERVAQALEKVGLAGYEGRYPYELSGGEKQRVAIARAIIKDSGVILADEPTGNLDSENGEEIFGILKELSREKLVIVVSHDRGFAEKYGDRIVELKDGVIISDSAPQPLPAAGEGGEETVGGAGEADAEDEQGVKPHLPTLLAFRMGWRNFAKKKIKSIVTFIVASLAMAALVLAQICVSFNAEHAIAKTVKRNGLEHITFEQRSYPDRFTLEAGSGHPIRDGYRRILGDIPFLEKYSTAEDGPVYVVEGREQLEQNGFELYEGSEELTDDSLYLTDYFLSGCYRANWLAMRRGNAPVWYLREGEELVPLYSDVYAVEYDMQPFIGKTLVNMSADPACNSCNIAGVVYTGYERRLYAIQYSDESGILANKPWDVYVEEYGSPSGAYYDEEFRDKHNYFLSSEIESNTYCTREYVLRHQSGISFRSEEYDPHELVISAERKNRCDRMYFYNIAKCDRSYGSLIMEGSDTTVAYSDIKLEAGEIILDERSYNSLYGGLSCEGYLHGSTVLQHPARLGETLHLFVERGGKVILDKDFKLVGVEMSEAYERPDDSDDKVSASIYVGEEDMYDLATEGLFPHKILLRTDSVKEGKLYRALRGLRYDNALAAVFEYSDDIYSIEPHQKLVGYAFLAIGVIMALVTLLIVVSLISYNILAQKREIGILRALGARASDVSKIYFAQATILSAVTFIASMAIALALVAVLNAVFAKAILAGLVLLGSTVLTWVVLIFGSFGLMFAGTLLPLRKISRYRPADAIKQT